jgi:SAM-dependent methyltransferase
MSLKRSIVSAIRWFSRAPPLSSVLFRPAVQRTLQSLPVFRTLYGDGWDLIHTFDRLNGTDTSGYVASEDLPNSRFSDTGLHVYGGSQPSIIRSALRELPDVDGFTFVDLGAGKGRPTLVATEFPFKAVVGVELSPALVNVALENAAVFRTRHPARQPARFENADAAVYPLPAGDLVVFLYNPFGGEVMDRVVANMETALADEPRSLFVVYYNPVCGERFDASLVLQRYYAGTVAYAADELGFGPDDADPVVIWQGGSNRAAKPGADAAIAITNPGYRCQLIGREAR